MRFNSNYDIRFNNNRFYFDDETIVRNFFDFNNKVYNRFRFNVTTQSDSKSFTFNLFILCD